MTKLVFLSAVTGVLFAIALILIVLINKKD